MAQFRPGRSGNPKGRPKGARNLAAQYLAEVHAPETSDPEAVSKLQAAIKAQIARAVAGDIRAVRDVIERVEKWEAERSRERVPNFTAADREVIAEIHSRLAPSTASRSPSPVLRTGEENQERSSPACGGGVERSETEGGTP